MTIGPWPKHEVVLMAVRKAVSAATRTFTANSMIRCFFIFFSLIHCFNLTQISQKSQIILPLEYLLPLLSSCVPSVASGKAERGGARGGLNNG